jgi:hypothetical protein
MFLCNGFRRNSYFAGKYVEKVIHKMTTIPINVAVKASGLFVRLLIIPNKNNPSMAPAKMPESAHPDIEQAFAYCSNRATSRF